MRAPTGEQHELTRSTPAGRARAVITEVGAGLRVYEAGGVALTEPFPVDRTPPMACGTVLVPWPNRVADARWTLDGEPQQLDVTEPATGNAIHGLLRYSPYRLAERDEGSVTLAATVFPRRGYPFLLDTSVRHELVDDGMRVTHTIVNVGARPAPVAVGVHPYLRIGDVPSEDLMLTVAASTHLTADGRGNVTGEHPTAGTDFSLRRTRVADVDLDDGFAELVRTDTGAVARLEAPDGRAVELWVDEAFDYLQVFTPRGFGWGDERRTAVAIEPMTAPANALNTGRGLCWLAPGGQWSVTWGLRHVGL